MGGKRNKKSKKKKKTYTKAQQMAKARIAAKKEATKTTKTTTSYRSRKEGLEANQQRIANKQVTGTTAQVAKDNKRYGNTVPSGSFDISKEGRDQAAINRGVVAAKKTGIPSGSNLKEGSFGISEAGKKKAAINRAEVKKSSPPKVKFKEAPKLTLKVDPIDGTEIAQTRFKSVPAGGPAGDNMSTREFREGMLPGLRDVVPGESLQNTLKRITNQDKLAAADADTTGLGIGPSTVNAFKIKSPTTYGAPSQEAVDKAAGITAGGLNIGGGGFTPDKPRGRSTSRAIFTGKNPDTSDIPASSFNFGPTADGNEYARNLNEFGMRFGATPEARADAYDRSLTGRKNLFDGATVGSGPVASPDAYARGLQVSRFGSPMNIGKTILNTIPGVNFRLQNDKELADSVARAPDLNRRRRGSSGNTRLPVAPLTPEEILLPEETAVAQTAPAYQQAQTGVDPNRLMQIQQEAYLQAFNPSYNPMFRFFGRRGMGRGSFRKAFRRRD